MSGIPTRDLNPIYNVPMLGTHKATLKVTDTTTGAAVEFTTDATTGAIRFSLLPGHSYALGGGS